VRSYIYRSITSPHLSCESRSVLVLANANPLELAAFHAACLPAHFGHGSESVYDESYRLAREMLPERFKLNFDPIEESNGILSNIATVCRISISSISTQLYKVNSYGPGGFFRAHKDTPREAHHIGTLVIALPTTFEGGEFTLRHGSTEHVLDWSINGRGEYANELHWIFFYSDVEHEINSVKNGYRITISYNICGHHRPYHDVRRISPVEWQQYQDVGEDEDDFGKITETPRVYRNLDPEHNTYKAALKKVDIAWKLSPIFGGLLDAFHNNSFLPNGGRLAFGLDHEYSFSGHRRPVKGFDWCLKGRDAAMFAAVKVLGLPYELKAVYKLKDYGDEIARKPQSPIDDFSSCHNKQYPEYLVIWDDFSGLSANEIGLYAMFLLGFLCRAAPGDPGSTSVIGEFLELGAHVDFTLVWAHYPTTMDVACRYIGYGNEPSLEEIYVAAALIINVPRFGTHGRIGTFY